MLAGRPKSVWNQNAPITDHPQQSGGVEVDVAVVGGGIAGVTTALLLNLSGKRVGLLEARWVGRQVTGHSTAKITSLHSLIYADLIAHLGEDAARLSSRTARTRSRLPPIATMRASSTWSAPPAPISAAKCNGTTAIAPGAALAKAPRSSPTAA